MDFPDLLDDVDEDAIRLAAKQPIASDRLETDFSNKTSIIIKRKHINRSNHSSVCSSRSKGGYDSIKKNKEREDGRTQKRLIRFFQSTIWPNLKFLEFWKRVHSALICLAIIRVLSLAQ